ncbi:glutaredoxin [Enterobacteriaceae bacterium H20N1]|uniref:Methylamine utilization protein MauE n=1 Tax=Dryocola boscaweniae TaxID=2925397 RepID=A0A9X2WAA1_9ENTR|nr:glutaredoxin family protein [Dryocola boscaweniae]MCT4703660.1 glutaredoxin [Dryocola boscaweniae]MCT4720828.1 glutaredoxin [Dryocola boscaweniae]
MSETKTAILYRMVMKEHVCPYGLKARYLLKHQGFTVDDRWLTSREETDRFQAEHQVKTTPQIFIDGKRIGGYDELRKYVGKTVKGSKETSYQPVLVVFAIAALMAVAAGYIAFGNPFTTRVLEWFIAFSMCLLAMLKLRDVEQFSTMFLGYDLLAQRWVPYSYLYPFGEALAGILMIASVLTFISAPVALFIGTVGAVSVIKAVYIDKRELKCACVGGDSNVPLGFISLTENLLMMAMGIAMGAKALF